MKKIFLPTIFILLSLSLVKANNVLIVGTYDSFSAEWGPGPIIKTQFEKTCNCAVQYDTTSQSSTLPN